MSKSQVTSVSGYQYGAKENQDARTQPSNRANSDGQVYKSSAALDSQVMYEAFSNFQAFADDQPELYMNRVLAKHTDLLKAWGDYVCWTSTTVRFK